jgi:ATP-dependent DNA helicase RecQ
MKNHLRVSKYLENQNQLKKDQPNQLMKYVGEDKVCKSKLILDYYFAKKQLLIAAYVLTVSLKSKKKI